jgi:hypothetical protein
MIVVSFDCRVSAGLAVEAALNLAEKSLLCGGYRVDCGAHEYHLKTNSATRQAFILSIPTLSS